jgi:signal transduction histidine kinase/ActR/RegA family two-component response regulator
MMLDRDIPAVLGAAEPARILLVDDYPPNLLALEVVLEPLGHELVRATSSDEAVNRLLEDEYAAVILDVQMPGIDGLTTARRIRNDPLIRHVPILFMTAQTYDDDRAATAYSLGAVDYILKPFQPETLRAKVNVFIELHQKKSELRRSERRRFDEAQMLRERHAGLAMDVGMALTRGEGLRSMLQQCTDSLVNRLAAAQARIWTLNDAEHALDLAASAGQYRHLDREQERIPLGQREVGVVAEQRRAMVTNQAATDPRIGDQTWVAREGMVSFAGYPLLLGDRMVGVMAMFARQPLSRDTLDVLGTVADSIALGIHRKWAEQERARLLARERRHNEQLQGLAEAALAMNSAVSLEAVLQTLADRACSILGAHRAVASLAESESWASVKRAESTSGKEASAPPGPGAELTAPLVGRDGREFGSIALSGHDGGFSKQDLRVLLHLSQVASAVFENTRLYQQTLAAEITLRELNRSLERSNRELDEFAYVASHDLKAPLRGIAHLSAWLEEDLGPLLPQASHEHLGLLRGRVLRLEALIDGILDYSRAGRQRHKLERVDVARLLREAAELLSPRDGVDIQIGTGMPVLTTERVPLLQVFMNLLGNALKHGGRDDLCIEVSWRDQGARGEFRVRDNGAGIAPEFHQRIWGIFQTLRPRDQVEGTGIGLSVVKKAVESRGGQVWVESAADQGTTFGFTWPNVPAT